MGAGGGDVGGMGGVGGVGVTNEVSARYRDAVPPHTQTYHICICTCMLPMGSLRGIETLYTHIHTHTHTHTHRSWFWVSGPEAAYTADGAEPAANEQSE